jgi:hypothetical protein
MTAPAGSGAPPGSGADVASVLFPAQEATAQPPLVSRPTTRSQLGIRRPKVYTDGTVRYNSCQH